MAKVTCKLCKTQWDFKDFQQRGHQCSKEGCVNYMAKSKPKHIRRMQRLERAEAATGNTQPLYRERSRYVGFDAKRDTTVASLYLEIPKAIHVTIKGK